MSAWDIDYRSRFLNLSSIFALVQVILPGGELSCALSDAWQIPGLYPLDASNSQWDSKIMFPDITDD